MTPTGREPITIIVVDDDDMFAESIERVLSQKGLEVVGRAASCATAVELATELQPSVAVVDYQLPDGNGAAAAAHIHDVSPETRVLILTGVTSQHLMSAALDSGSAGFLTKDKAARDLVRAIRQVDSGESFLAPDALSHLLDRD